MLVKAVHTIHRSKKLDPSVVKPGEIFEPTAKELKSLQDLNAITEPTKAELAAAKLNLDLDDDGDVAPKSTAKGKKASKQKADHSASDDTGNLDLDDDGELDGNSSGSEDQGA